MDQLPNEIDRFTLAFLKAKMQTLEESGIPHRDALRLVGRKMGVGEKMVEQALNGKRSLSTKSAQKLAMAFNLTHMEMLSSGRNLLNESEEPSPDGLKEHPSCLPAKGETGRLLKMAMTVLGSGGKYATALKENIEAFHMAATGEGAIKDPLAANDD